MESNPYQSPAAPSASPAASASLAESGGTAPFLPPRTMVIPLLYLGAVMSLITAITMGLQYALLSRVMAGDTISSNEATMNDMQVAVAAVLYGLVFLATIVAWWRWQLRAAHNLRAFASGLEFTPGWTIGWFFVPIANLFKPYQAMKEIYNVSDPSFAADEYRRTNNLGAGAVIGWWTLWITGNLVGQISWRLPTETVSDMRLETVVGMVEVGLHLPLCLVAASMIRTINRHQLARQLSLPVE